MAPSAARIVGRFINQFETLFTIINGYSGLALTDAPTGGPRREELGEIAAAGEQASHLTRQLAAFAAYRSVPLHPLDLNGLIEELGNRIRQALPCGVEFRLQPAAAKTLGNADVLREEIPLLFDDASRRLRSADRLVVRTEARTVTKSQPIESGELNPGVYAVLTIRDTGEAIAPSASPFALAHARLLGLVLSAGGGLDVKSSADRGNTIEVFLPSA